MLINMMYIQAHTHLYLHVYTHIFFCFQRRKQSPQMAKDYCPEHESELKGDQVADPGAVIPICFALL